MKTPVVIVMLSLIAGTLSAQLRTGDNVLIDERTNSDLYVAGGTVTINSPVHGDLVVAGGTIIVNDSVSEDVLVAGGNITINGFVGDDVRVAGGTVQLHGLVGGDLIATAGQLMIQKSAVVYGNLISGAGTVKLDGTVKGNITDASGDFTLNGNAERDFTCKGGEIHVNGLVVGKSVMAANVIELGSEARFLNDVKYWNKAGTLDFKKSLQDTKATFDPGLEIENGRWHYLGFASFLMVLWYLGTALVMITLIQYSFSLTLRNAANTVKKFSLKSLGLGFLFFIGMPVAIVVLFVTIVGLPVAILMLIAYIAIILLGTVIVSVLISNWINNTCYRTSWGNGRMIFAAFVIFIFLKLASLTPFLGPLIMLLLACMAIGGIIQNIRWRKEKELALT